MTTDKTLKTILEGMTLVGEVFMDSIIHQLTQTFDMRYGLAGKVVEKRGTKYIQTLSFSINGQKQENFSYLLAGTPCEKIIERNNVSCFPDDLQGLFPDAINAKKLQLNSFWGGAIHNTKGEAIGILSMFDEEPAKSVPDGEYILSIFAARLSAEIGRLEHFNSLKSKNVQLLEQREEILNQRNLIEKQKEHLEETLLRVRHQEQRISKSIMSAQKIQESILPKERLFSKLFQSYFIIYEPKDIVSGDFFWASTVKNRIIIVVADCTGHGVPGAFMSMIGNTLLNKIIREQEIVDPAKALELLDSEFKSSIYNKDTQGHYGMDLGICVIENDNNTRKIVFAGAKRPLYVFKPTEKIIEKYKSSRRSIGVVLKNETAFENTTLCLPPNSILYMGSDGLEDQNNVRRKRFGENNLIKLLTNIQEQPLSLQKNSIKKALQEHMKNTEQRDDILLLAVKL
ncbi:MAG TPA: hypothetical protein DCS93_19410 [Microscillaceae bacterium]|nr:hypothetical protein [Microscillaceae bacterium]